LGADTARVHAGERRPVCRTWFHPGVRSA
jgi:hypothetical protein